MRLLVISDIHGNLEALEAVLSSAQGRYDQCVCLGDIVGYGADPNSTADRVREIAAVVIRGNHDRACASLEGIDTFTPVAALAARWTHDNLRAETRTWLQSLPKGPVEYANLVLAHGSPLDEDEYVLSTAQAALALVRSAAAVTCIGHTHIQGGYLLDGEDPRISELQVWGPESHTVPLTKEETSALALAANERLLANPGSVGQPRDGDWRAAYAIWDDEHREMTFFRVPYDIRTAQKKIMAAGLPERLATRLGYGQ